MSAPPFLVRGADGQIGHELSRALCIHGRTVRVTRAECDLEDFAADRRLVRAHPRSPVFNAAAYTAVDAAEADAPRAFRLNDQLPGILADEARAQQGLLVHFSTDYVFDGAKQTGYVEEDETAPLNVYGESKLAGERRVLDSGVDSLVFRTSWIYGTRGRNFLRSILAAARTRSELRVVTDQRGAPTWSRLVAHAATHVATSALALSAEARRDVLGMYHLTASGVTTWHGFAERIVAIVRESEEIPCREVIPITSEALGAAAPRPRNSVLSNAKLEGAFGIVLPSWEDQLRLALAP